ncbi:precorrin-6y C5,15-methyltransferase (decarboxylating) subunit CbiE [Nocardia callitridis]
MTVAWHGRPIEVVGVGADGIDGLGRSARDAIDAADLVAGSRRQLDLVGVAGARRIEWPSPLVPALPGLLEQWLGRRVCVLASGDPMFYGIGVTLARLVGASALRVLPQPSSVSLACARLGWALASTPVVNVVGRPLSTVLPELVDGRRVLVLSEDERTPGALADLLTRNGFGKSSVTVLEQLGGSRELLVSGVAKRWDRPHGDSLNIVALDCVAERDLRRATRIPGLDDEFFGGDGQLTKHEVRALTLSALAPAPGELLWDIGGGSGSIAIEWSRTHPACRAVTFERLARRRTQIADNAEALGVSRLEIRGEFVGESAAAPTPDAVFLGGGLTADGVFETCWARLRAGGRLVANAVTAESESALLALSAEHGGELRKYQIYRAEPLGGFRTWRPQLPVTQWWAVKPGGLGEESSQAQESRR